MANPKISRKELSKEDRKTLKLIIDQSKKTWLIIASILIVVEILSLITKSFSDFSIINILLILPLPFLFIFFIFYINTYKVKRDLREGYKEVHHFLITDKVTYEDSTNKWGGTETKYKVCSGITKLPVSKEQYKNTVKGDYYEMHIAFHSAYHFPARILNQESFNTNL